MTARVRRGTPEVRESYWFAQKRFGYGAVPVTWQGWLTTLVYLVLIAAIALEVPGHVLKAGLMLPLSAVYIYFIWTKTEGGFRWRWGTEKK